ncbi:TIGR02677 family protein [Actinokineospora diospyrosa]|uniref:TIGR02677 family protein n=1 Tax=Actinokineospora diospyrosa TaxID=103728 RepID=A0ABT1IKG2_9PSEU|nr:TIGR02677 family protein [Actinokineospora diospyrosa]MCP2273130.1 TIGR02677 family protein [Actinokineospora diospyrosa]
MASEGKGGAHAARTSLFAYLTAGQSGEYRAIMDLFTGPLLTDLSAGEVSHQLGERGVTLSVDEATLRCEQLETWGNLVRGVRDARVPTVREFLKSRGRYQASKLGGRVHRDAEAVLAAGDGAQEVARELLGATVHLLDRVLARIGAAEPDAEALAADVTTVFNNQQLFNESVRDFYAYLNGILSRYDLAGEEYHRFKELLLEYIDLITADVSRHAPAIAARCVRLVPVLDRVLAVLDELPVPAMPDGTPADRLPGRHRADWEQLHDWYAGTNGRSGPETLRAAADQALRQLLTNAKRMLAAAGTGVSRRADLLKLASWFDGSDSGAAHRLYAATFGAYPVRHLSGGPEELGVRDGASTSWWDATPVDVPISLRDRGDRSARGRTSSVPDPGLDAERLLAQAREEAREREQAAAELVAAGELDGARVSPAARELLLGLLSSLLAKHQDMAEPATETNTDLELLIEAEPALGANTTLHARDGSVVVHDLRLTARRPSSAGGARSAGAG